MGRGDMRGDGLPVVSRPTEQQRRAATITVCEHAANPADARALLGALGLIEPPPPPPQAPAKRTYTDAQRVAASARKSAAARVCRQAAAVLGMSSRAYLERYGYSAARARAFIEEAGAPPT